MKSFSLAFLFLVGLLGITNTSKICAQNTTELIIPYESQKTNFWCWAASMKMILDFHEPTNASNIVQCSLAMEMYKLDVAPGLHSIIDNITCCTRCDAACLATQTIKCPDNGTSLQTALGNKTVDYHYQGSSDPATPDHYDLLFSQKGFTSIQQINMVGDPMEWDHIKKQITDCRPFIINLKNSPITGANGNHAMVVKGFREETIEVDEDNDGVIEEKILKTVIANDPWRPCCNDSNESLIPYDDFTEANATDVVSGDFIYYVQSTIHTIQPGTIFEGVEKSACKSCDFLEKIYPGGAYIRVNNEDDQLNSSLNNPFLDINATGQKKFISNVHTIKGNSLNDNEPSRLLEALDNNKTRVIGYPQTAYQEDIFKERINQDGYPYAPVEFISSSLLNKSGLFACLLRQNKLYKVSIPDVYVVELLNGNIENTVVASTFQKNSKEAWKLRKMSTYSYLSNDLRVAMDTVKGAEMVSLNNQKGASDNEKVVDFRLVKYYPFQYEFFSFTRDGKELMAPAGDYESSLGLKQKVAYNEQKVIRKLRRKTRQYEKGIKNGFPTLKEYQAILKALGNLIPSKKPIYDGIKVPNESIGSNPG